MTRIAPDARQLGALQAQLGLLEQMLKPVMGGAPATAPAPSNVVPMPQRGPPPQQAAMLEQMLAGVDPQRAAHVRSLMSVASKPNVSPQEMETAVAPLLATLSPQDQGTVRMMLSMMQQSPMQGAAVTQALVQQQQANPTAAPVVAGISPEVQQALDAVTARAATALEEARRVAAELVSLKDTQNQTAAAMFQQTQVMKDLLRMLKAQVPEATGVEVLDEDHPTAGADENQPVTAAS